jgi:3',5'-cyclic AMP phosphodiesterase CpdA
MHIDPGKEALPNVLTIVQITDLHISRAARPQNQARNAARLRTVLKAIAALKPRPVAILATGDLVDEGLAEEYAALKDIMAESAIPVHFGIGNHDSRAGFQAAFPHVPADENGFVQYAVTIGGLRVLMCDTVEGKDRGGFCDKRAAWLAAQLDAAPDEPTLLALHHPPVPSGIPWMDEAADAPWLKRLAAVIEGRRQIKGLISGHMHRAYGGVFAGHPVSVSWATSVQLALDLRPIDRNVPDHREIVVDSPPGFTLLRWDQERLTVHSCVAGDFPPIATFEHPFPKD